MAHFVSQAKDAAVIVLHQFLKKSILCVSVCMITCIPLSYYKIQLKSSTATLNMGSAVLCINMYYDY